MDFQLQVTFQGFFSIAPNQTHGFCQCSHVHKYRRPQWEAQLLHQVFDLIGLKEQGHFSSGNSGETGITGLDGGIHFVLSNCQSSLVQVHQLLRGHKSELSYNSPHGLPGSVGNCEAVEPAAL